MNTCQVFKRRFFIIRTKKRRKELLQEQEITYAELAKRLSIPKGTISNWFNRKSEPTIGYVIKLADYFQVTTDYLLGREDYGTGIVEIRQPARENKVPDKNLDERLKFIEEQFLLLNIENQMQVLGFIQALKYKQQKKN